MRDTITLPRALARVLMQSAYWPCIGADILDAVGGCPCDMVDARQEAVDGWFSRVAEGLPGSPSSDDMLAAVQAAWARGSRPGGAR